MSACVKIHIYLYPCVKRKYSSSMPIFSSFSSSNTAAAAAAAAVARNLSGEEEEADAT